jgi:prevent-host-death family protein
MGKMIGAAEFKAKCLRILDEVERTGESVTVTKRGRPFAQVKPIAKKERRSIIGALKGTVLKYERPFDPALDPGEWDANR